MAKQNPIQSLLSKPLSRKEFLQHIGVLLLSVIGINQAIQHLLRHNPQPDIKTSGSRWGGGKFGV